MRRPLLEASVLALFLAAFPGFAAGNETASPQIRVHYYPVYGSSSAELKAAMRARGPHGWWAYTEWWVRWTGDCQVSLSIDYTLPRWMNESEAAAGLQDEWNRMFVNLWTHEKGHGRHGINAAKEVILSNCAGNPRDITDKWANEDKVYDAETNHGVRQGVALP